mmetsp:Transcript_47072/g.100877  ORF Transcript_47072/g.100877 Transcript_47072/m.100877 type:complete len:218 (-) Transcript_47072:717-1370(-)
MNMTLFLPANPRKAEATPGASVLIHAQMSSCVRTCRFSTVRSGNMSENTQQGTTAKGLPCLTADSQIAPVASSGCKPTSTDARATASRCAGTSKKARSIVVLMCRMCSANHCLAGSPLKPFSCFKRLNWGLLSFTARGSTTVTGMPCASASSNDNSPRPPATSNTPPCRRAGSPYVSISHLENTEARWLWETLSSAPCGSSGCCEASARLRFTVATY